MFFRLPGILEVEGSDVAGVSYEEVQVDDETVMNPEEMGRKCVVDQLNFLGTLSVIKK